MVEPSFEPAWREVLDHWEDDAAHRAFLDHCLATDRLAAAAASYRGLLDAPERREQAARAGRRALAASAALRTAA